MLRGPFAGQTITCTCENDDAYKAEFLDNCVKRNLQLTDYFWGKIVQIYDMMVVRFVYRRFEVFSVC